jgi:hypothetical protein
MSPASYLAAPPRVAKVDCSTLVTIRSMADWALNAAVILAVLSATSALAYAITQVLHVWRALKRLRRNALREVDRLVELSDEAVAKAEHAADSTLLQTKLARLRVTLARFAVLRQALDEVSATAGRVTAVYPRK